MDLERTLRAPQPIEGLGVHPAAAEDAGVQRAFDDVEAARQEAEVVSRVGGASNRRLYRRAAAEDAGVSQRAFDDVEAARQEADVAFRWRALCECEDNRQSTRPITRS